MATLTLWVAGTKYPDPVAVVEVIEPITEASFLENITLRNIHEIIWPEECHIQVHWVNDGYVRHGEIDLSYCEDYSDFISELSTELWIDV